MVCKLYCQAHGAQGAGELISAPRQHPQPAATPTQVCLLDCPESVAKPPQCLALLQPCAWLGPGFPAYRTPSSAQQRLATKIATQPSPRNAAPYKSKPGQDQSPASLSQPNGRGHQACLEMLHCYCNSDCTAAWSPACASELNRTKGGGSIMP